MSDFGVVGQPFRDIPASYDTGKSSSKSDERVEHQHRGSSHTPSLTFTAPEKAAPTTKADFAKATALYGKGQLTGGADTDTLLRGDLCPALMIAYRLL